jgi:hypothetical protein
MPSAHVEEEKPKINHQESIPDDEALKPPPQEPNADYSGSQKKTDPEEIRLVRKIDFIMMPILWIMYWFNYLDRNAITVARLDDLEDELKLSSTQYQTCVSILFVGYILGQIPSSGFSNHLFSDPTWVLEVLTS